MIAQANVPRRADHLGQAGGAHCRRPSWPKTATLIELEPALTVTAARARHSVR
jgi:hypothetical protein